MDCVKETIIGVISDTHGEVKREVVNILSDSHHIIHAGDIVGRNVLKTLGQIAKVTAVRGNMDYASSHKKLPQTGIVEIAGTLIYVIHNIAWLTIDPKAAGIKVVIHGHLHYPEVVEKNDVLYLNPGSSFSGRSSYGETVARLTISSGEIKTKIITL